MLDKLMFPGMMPTTTNPYAATQHYLEYEIDTALPSKAPYIEGDADLWTRMQNMYYAVVKITRQYVLVGDEANIHYDEYDMIIHFDVLLPYDKLAVTVQQFIQEILGPANRIFGNVKVYRKTTKYVPKEGWYIIKETPGMNIHQKLD